MDCDGHYNVERTDTDGNIRALICVHCGLRVTVRDKFRSGDKSGQGAYNRARAVMVKHLHDQHRDKLAEGVQP